MITLFRTLCAFAVAAAGVYCFLDVAVAAPIPSTESIVAADGSGNFKTVQEAVEAAPVAEGRRHVIRIRPGTYTGQIVIPKDKPRLTFYGDPAAAALPVLLSDRTVKSLGADGKEVGTVGSAAVVVRGDDFRAEGVTFENNAPHTAQALAIYVDADRAIFTGCRFLGYQDTIRLRSGRQYFADCTITGRTDFIYGEGTGFFDRCRIECGEGGWITAANTPQNHPYGLVFSQCKILTTVGTGRQKTYLGRPWRDYANVVFLNCDLGPEIHPAGWHNWDKPEREKTVRYAEYGNTGPGAGTGQRVSWARQLTPDEASKITVETVLGGSDNWNPKTEATVRPTQVL